VADIVGEISAASSEQSIGVAQVGEAVTQLDQATQQNAALVEESAAAAESMRFQAEQLVQAVAVFRTSLSSPMVAEPAARPEAARTLKLSESRQPMAARSASGTAVVRAPARSPVLATAGASPARAGLDDWESF
jgi:hypothetical protein